MSKDNATFLENIKRTTWGSLVSVKRMPRKPYNCCYMLYVRNTWGIFQGTICEECLKSRIFMEQYERLCNLYRMNTWGMLGEHLESIFHSAEARLIQASSPIHVVM